MQQFKLGGDDLQREHGEKEVLCHLIWLLHMAILSTVMYTLYRYVCTV